MNRAMARQREDNQRWNWSTRNDSQVWTSEPCSNVTTDSDGKLGRGEPCDHATREEAERHFYDFSLGHLVEIDLVDTRRVCSVDGCEEWTSMVMENRGMGLAFGIVGLSLCDQHRNREQFARLRPFTPGMAITHS